MHPKIKILNVGFNPTNYDELVDYLIVKNHRFGYICFPDLYNIVRANEDDILKKIYKNSNLTLPDGKPSEIMLKRKGLKDVTTISGYWLCRRLLKTELSHFIYGTSPSNLQKMQDKIRAEFPSANILGFKSPPLLSDQEILTSKDLEKDIEEIFDLRPDVIWIGISSPKQDLLMDRFQKSDKGTVLIGVGAVFDYFAGTAYMGPEWLKKVGMRWLYQLIKDPKRYLSRIVYILVKIPRLLVRNKNLSKV